MNNDFNKSVVSMDYEIFMKKCVGKFPKNRHLWSSDNMALLLSQSDYYNNNSVHFERVQDYLLIAVNELIQKNSKVKKPKLLELKDEINHAFNVYEIVKCLELGLNLLGLNKT
jgi:hypothetical protein